MTKVHPSSMVKIEASLPSEPPPRTSFESKSSEILEKQSPPCYIHGPSQTPYLDAHLRQPSTVALIGTLSSTLAGAGNENCCSKCVTKNAAQSLALYLRELRAAKKNGEWSAEEKKALKKEVKGLFKEIKHDVRKTWKAKH